MFAHKTSFYVFICYVKKHKIFYVIYIKYIPIVFTPMSVSILQFFWVIKNFLHFQSKKS